MNRELIKLKILHAWYIKHDMPKHAEKIKHKIDNFKEDQAMKSIIIEPNWPNMYRWFMQVKRDDIKVFNRMIKKMGSVEWDKLVACAKRDNNNILPI